MTAEQKKDLVRRYYQEVWSKGNLDFVDQIFTDDYVNCDPATPGGRVEGGPAFKELVKTLRGAFQDMAMTIDHQHVDGDVVVSEWTAKAVHRGALMGIPPTGKAFECRVLAIFEFEGEGIVCERVYFDTATILGQLGLLPGQPDIGV